MSFPNGNWIKSVFLFIAYIANDSSGEALIKWCHQKGPATLKSGFPFSTAVIPEGYPEGWVRMVLDLNFTFRHSKRRHALHDTARTPERSKALKQRKVEPFQFPKLHLYKYRLKNCQLHGNSGITNNTTQHPLTAMRMDSAMARACFRSKSGYQRSTCWLQRRAGTTWACLGLRSSILPV